MPRDARPCPLPCEALLPPSPPVGGRLPCGSGWPLPPPPSVASGLEPVGRLPVGEARWTGGGGLVLRWPALERTEGVAVLFTEMGLVEVARRSVDRPDGLDLGPEEVPVRNPAFDITPARYVSAIVTEKGVLRPPYGKAIKKALG